MFLINASLLVNICIIFTTFRNTLSTERNVDSTWARRDNQNLTRAANYWHLAPILSRMPATFSTNWESTRTWRFSGLAIRQLTATSLCIQNCSTFSRFFLSQEFLAWEIYFLDLFLGAPVSWVLFPEAKKGRGPRPLLLLDSIFGFHELCVLHQVSF